MAILCGCMHIPENVKPVENFDANKYLGTWYEIARTDNKYEKGLIYVQANYSLNSDGLIKLINSGYNSNSRKVESVQGVAKFIDSPDTGLFKVSFFRPFYSAYVVFKLNEVNDDYQQAYVASDNNSLWFLSKTLTVSQKQKQDFITEAKGLGIDTDKLIWVDHEKCINDIAITECSNNQILPPKYLSIKGFKKCFSIETKGSARFYCMPKDRPEDCFYEAWEQLNHLEDTEKIPQCK